MTAKELSKLLAMYQKEKNGEESVKLQLRLRGSVAKSDVHISSQSATFRQSIRRAATPPVS